MSDSYYDLGYMDDCIHLAPCSRIKSAVVDDFQDGHFWPSFRYCDKNCDYYLPDTLETQHGISLGDFIQELEDRFHARRHSHECSND